MKYLTATLFLLTFLVSCASNNDLNESEIKQPAGFVILSFDINEQGKTTNIKVLDSQPQGKFDSAAIKALSNWKHKPKVVDRIVISQKDLTVKLVFNPEN